MHTRSLITWICLILPGCTQLSANDVTIPDSVAYLGQTPPGETPEVFAPGIVNLADRNNRKVVFSPDGKEILIGVRADDVPTFLLTKFDNGLWTAPEPAGVIVANQHEKEPFFSPDGKKLFFVKYATICVSNRLDESWSAPKALDSPVNVYAEQYHPTVTLDGTLYFCSNRGGAYNIYRSRFENGRYATVEVLDSVINSHVTGSDGAYDPFIAPDESYIIFSSTRNGGAGKEDQYISYNQGGHWTTPVSLGSKINTAGTEYGSYVSPDGKYYFFARQSKDNLSEICWVRATFTDEPRHAKTTAETVPPAIKGAFFGLTPPGETPVLFAPEVLSSVSPFVEATAFSPGGTLFFLAVGAADYSSAKLYFSKCVNGVWTPFAEPPFVSDFTFSHEPVFAADGATLTFTGMKATGSIDLWTVSYANGEWGTPVALPSPINSDARDYRGSYLPDGTAYFCSNRSGMMQVYKAFRDSTEKLVAVKLESPINMNAYEGDPCIAPDGRFLIFYSGRDGVSTDLHVSFSDGNGGWNAPIKLGADFNSSSDEYGTHLSSDGKYLFFTRHTPQGNGIYWVAISAIEKLKL